MAALLLTASAAPAAETITAGGLAYINHGLAGVGRIPAVTRDKFGETFGSGSGLAVDVSSWQRSGAGYRGTFYMLPDRGYNIEGTFDYRARLNRLEIVFDPPGDPWMLPVDARQNSVVANLTDTIPLTDHAGAPLTGLDPTDVRPAAGRLSAAAAGGERTGQHRFGGTRAAGRRRLLRQRRVRSVHLSLFA